MYDGVIMFNLDDINTKWCLILRFYCTAKLCLALYAVKTRKAIFIFNIIFTNIILLYFFV